MLAPVLSLISLTYGFLASAPAALALGSACSSALTSGTAAPTDPYWMQSIKHQGISAFNPDPSSYTVFRNVEDYGAVGDGNADDTDAINSAISLDSCGNGTCASSTVTPAVVYFPQGTYKVSAPLNLTYYTQMIGDAKVPPTLLASRNFTGLAVIDANPYLTGGNGANWYNATNNFYRAVRNFVIDLTDTPANASSTGIHWQVSQATSLHNVVFEMSTASDTAHQGIFMENGSGGKMGDLVFNGGKYAMWLGNQQFTVRNVTMNNCQTAVYMAWNWGWTFQDVTINDCEVGFDVTTGGLTKATQTAGSMAIIDATASNTPVFYRTSEASNGTLAGSIVLNNIVLNNVSAAVSVLNHTEALLEGGTMTIDSWGQGNVYSGTSGSATFTAGDITGPSKASSLMAGDKIFGRTIPQYEDYAVDQFVSVKDQGAKGDGSTDDTAALQAVFNKYSGCAIIYFDAGTYVVTSTLQIPAGTQMVGEVWAAIMGSGSAFEDQTNPSPVVQVGAPGSSGIMEISNMIFTTKGPAAGAIVVEWNVNSPAQGGAGMWDSFIRLGGAVGTDLEVAQCDGVEMEMNSPSCSAAFLGLHLTANSNAYIEGTWVWLADHDLDDAAQSNLTLYSGRGILSESAGPVWMIGTAEHHVLYQYNLAGAQNHYIGVMQSETPYFQPLPVPPVPFSINGTYKDPSFPISLTAAWGLYVQSSTDITVFGAGLYSFYQDYGQTCLNTTTCQMQIVNVDSSSTRIGLYSLSTVGVVNLLSVDSSPVIAASSNTDGIQDTVTSWTQ
ncbi:glycoside hydrolase family 55 protein [Fomitopsis serialis]|uniref:glycoside hydrolase family 55 protein n=1 Tax=Fomitopsis serialis TaxID=139415 RepID=UPI002007DD0E|nr:glycoside hydrolase family 55 protein [Neoantrodia serialis]KAH9934691.1 glycoside hydrolase family 55 protein [Neoantrodia serialis]